MNYPAFYDLAPTLAVHDPLAEFLGAAAGGVIEYRYADAVRLAGHSCPTVAGAYLMMLKALRHLYGDALPERGGVAVEFREDRTSGVTGVMANIAALITGATQDMGFKGIGGRFDRRNLLFFNADIDANMRLRRIDTGASVEATYHPEIVPMSDTTRGLLREALDESASTEARAEFARLWQERVRRILVDGVNDPRLVILSAAH